MRVTIPAKMSNTGSIHDISSQHADRVIIGRGAFAVVLAAYYGGKGYTTHTTEHAAMLQARKIQKAGYSYQIIDAEGNTMQECNGELFCTKQANERELIAQGMEAMQ